MKIQGIKNLIIFIKLLHMCIHYCFYFLRIVGFIDSWTVALEYGSSAYFAAIKYSIDADNSWNSIEFFLITDNKFELSLHIYSAMACYSLFICRVDWLIWWGVTLFLTIFQPDSDCQFYWWRKLGNTWRQATERLFHIPVLS